MRMSVPRARSVAERLRQLQSRRLLRTTSGATGAACKSRDFCPLNIQSPGIEHAEVDIFDIERHRGGDGKCDQPLHHWRDMAPKATASCHSAPALGRAAVKDPGDLSRRRRPRRNRRPSRRVKKSRKRHAYPSSAAFALRHIASKRWQAGMRTSALQQNRRAPLQRPARALPS